VTVVYLDSVFFLNALMDYLLLLATARLAGIPLRRNRYLLAAFAGGGYAAAVFLPGCGFLAETPVKAVAGVLLALIAFGAEEKLLRLTLLLFLLSCALAGCVLALGMLAGGGVPVVSGIFYTDVNGGVLLAATTAAYLLLSVVFRASARNGIRGHLLPVRLCINGSIAEFNALWDSGNALMDRETGRPVLVVSWEVVSRLLPWLSKEELLSPEGVLRGKPGPALRLIPYRAVGTTHGLLVSVRSDWAEIGGTRYTGLRVALSPAALGDGYAALWGGEWRRRGGRNGNLDADAALSDEAGTTAGGRDSLHQRQ